ncbi:MAG TPA: hypothetical protein VGD10_09240 [Allosphingosinicella sp.]|uniref:hypothetical protein n=1 Tax=Allosphingosinicella sp. TaxID=2823234 RepID=UPI002EDA0181
MKTIITAAAALAAAAPAAAQHAGHGSTPAPAAQPAEDHQAHQHGTAPEAAEAPAADHSQHQGMDHSQHGAAEAAPAEEHGDHGGGHQMTGALGPYPMSREASGTAWQPDTSEHMGLHLTSGDWTLMGHALLNGVYSWQEGPRGDDKAFVSGMVMGMARRDFANGNALQFRAMLSPDPFMGKRGYPLHLASGETADGETVLVDRQHPHDFFMELSASYSVALSEKSSVYLYGGLPGEPAFGPPAFMHRMSIMDSPEAPISHHWLDSTHITFGVVTAGLVLDQFKVEASRFNGREPDEKRYNIETGPLDSTAVRLSWNPTDTLSLQASWADLKEPEQLEPGEDQEKWSASAIYTKPIAGGWWSSTLAWGRRSGDHSEWFDAWVLESAVNQGPWTFFGRAEATENNELLSGDHGHHGPTFDVAKISVGALHDFTLSENVKLGVGGLYAFNFVPAALETVYGGDPRGAMAFVRLKID